MFTSARLGRTVLLSVTVLITFGLAAYAKGNDSYETTVGANSPVCSEQNGMLHCLTYLPIARVDPSPTPPPSIHTVSNLEDDGPGSLRQAIRQATAGDIIIFEAAGTIRLTSGRIFINKPITINGLGPEQTQIDAQGVDRVVEVYTSGNVQISGFTLTGGNATEGGGIRNNARLTISNVTVTNNIADSGGGVYSRDNSELIVVASTIERNEARYGAGGGVFASPTSRVSISDSQILGNSSGGVGGGIYGSGFLHVHSSRFSGNSSRSDGGGIYASEALTVTHSMFDENYSNDRGGGISIPNGAQSILISTSSFISNSAIVGAGLYISAHHADEEYEIQDSIFQSNSASRNGGGILIQISPGPGTADVRNCSFKFNSARLEGGGIHVTGHVLLRKSRFEYNSANTGGAIYSFRDLTLSDSEVVNNTANTGGGIAGRAIVETSRIEYNTAMSSGGGAYFGFPTASVVRHSVVNHNDSLGDGGGIAVTSIAVITASTISGNSAVRGGGVFNGSNVSLESLSILENQATASGAGVYAIDRSDTSTVIENSLVALNQAPNGPDVGGGIIESRGYNLFGSLEGTYIGGDETGNLYGIDPVLLPLDPGGFFIPQPQSPIIDAGSPVRCAERDQRLWTRPVDGNGDGVARCDIGAFEYYP